MTTPVRLQRSRRPGSNLQATSHALNGLDAVCVDRSSSWGNPFKPGRGVHMTYNDGTKDRLCITPAIRSNAEAVIWFRAMWAAMDANSPKFVDNWFKPLRGKNLACWCNPGNPCHADVLLEIANRPVCEAVG